MATTLSPKLEHEIVKRLTSGNDKDDIVMSLCEREGLYWNEAETLVNEIESAHQHAITLAQSPLLVGIALGTFLGGAALIVFAAYDLFRVLQSLAQTSATDLGTITGSTTYIILFGGQVGALALLGMGMILGSLKGMHAVWEAIFAKLGIF